MANVLLYVDHDNAAFRAVTLNAVTAAAALGDVTALVAGKDCGSVCEAVAKVPWHCKGSARRRRSLCKRIG